MSRERTLSHHLLRRTARAKRGKIRQAQRYASSGVGFAQAELKELGIDITTATAVESSLRGPFGWRVVAK